MPAVFPQQPALVRDLGVTHVLVDPQYVHAPLRRWRWAVYEVRRDGKRDALD
jgi:hypothetical protein